MCESKNAHFNRPFNEFQPNEIQCKYALKFEIFNELLSKMILLQNVL